MRITKEHSSCLDSSLSANGASKFRRRFFSGSVILVALGLALVIGNLWGNGFTSGDERFTAFARERFGGFWQASFSMASSQGRFYQLYVYPFAQVPYLVHSLTYTNWFRILSSGLVFVAFAFFILELWGAHLALMATAVSVGILNTRGGYNPFHGLPLWFNTGGMILLVSLTIYARGVRKRQSLLGPSFLGFLAFLYYEPFLLFLPLFSIVREFTLEKCQMEKEHHWIRRTLFQDRWIILFFISYLILYFGFRKIFPSTYQGNHLSLASFQDMFRPIWTFSWSGIFKPSQWSDIKTWNLRALITSILLTSSLGLTLLNFIWSEKSRWEHKNILLKSSLLLFPFIFVPNLLFGFTVRYREWVRSDPYYIGSYYSGFMICLWIALGIGWLVTRQKKDQIRLFREGAFVGFILILFGGVTYANQVQANRFFGLSRIEAKKWNLVDQVSQVLAIDHFQVRSLCTQTLIGGEDPYDYWSYYLSMRTKRKLTLRFGAFSKNECDAEIVVSAGQSGPYLELILNNGSKIKFQVK